MQTNGTGGNWPAMSEGAERPSRMVRKGGFDPPPSCECQPLKPAIPPSSRQHADADEQPTHQSNECHQQRADYSESVLCPSGFGKQEQDGPDRTTQHEDRNGDLNARLHYLHSLSPAAASGCRGGSYLGIAKATCRGDSNRHTLASASIRKLGRLLGPPLPRARAKRAPPSRRA